MKSAVNALTLFLAEQEDWNIPLPEAKAFAEAFFAENEELFAQPGPALQARYPRPPSIAEIEEGQASTQRAIESLDSIRPARVAPGRPGDLMPQQQAAIAQGIALCPNCHEPVNNHLPGCARVGVGGLPAVDPKAVTKAPLPPSS